MLVKSVMLTLHPEVRLCMYEHGDIKLILCVVLGLLRKIVLRAEFILSLEKVTPRECQTQSNLLY